MEQVFNILLDKAFVSKEYDNINKFFSIKIYENDIAYLYDNYEKIIDEEIRKNCLKIAVAFSQNTNIIIFLIDKFRINICEENYNYNSYFYNACAYNKNLPVIKYLFKNCKIEIDIECNNFYITDACGLNTNLEIIKYLIKKFKIENDNDFKYTIASLKNKNIEIIKFLIEHFCLNLKNLKDFESYNSLMSACQHNNIIMIKYLVEDCKIDTKYINNHNDDCLGIACLCNNNIEVIKYLIEECKMNPMRINNNNNNYLHLVCCREDDQIDALDIVKYFIEVIKVNTNFVNKQGNNCLNLACDIFDNINVIKYLIEDVKMDANQINNDGNNCLSTICCNFCTKVDVKLNIIKYFVEIIKIDPKYINQSGLTYLMMICVNNINIDIIKYFIEECEIDPFHIDNEGNNCLYYIFQKYNFDVNSKDIIKYLIETVKMNPNFIDKKGNTFLHIIGKNNNVDKFEILKYLIEECKIDVDHVNIDSNNCFSNGCDNWYISSKKGNLAMEYIIKIIKIDPNFVDKQGNTYLILACKYYLNLDVIKFLIEECKININQVNNEGINCLIQCLIISNYDVVKYLIETKKMDPNFIDIHGNTYLIKYCQIRSLDLDLEIIKYFIEICKINVYHVNNEQKNCLYYCCKRSNKISVIKYFIETCKMDHKLCDQLGNTYLHIVCNNQFPSISIIKYFVEDCKIDVNQLRSDGLNCLTIVFYSHDNCKIIKYLIEISKIKIDYLTDRNENYLMFACWASRNLKVIKYFIEECKMNINHKNIDNENCLMLAYRINQNLSIIKYLIEEVHMDVNANSNKCIYMICKENENFIQIIVYLIENTNITMNINNVSYEKFEQFLPLITNFDKLNLLLELASHNYNYTSMVSLIKKLNPIMLTKKFFDLCDINIPSLNKFNTFCQFVYELKCFVPLTIKHIIQNGTDNTLDDKNDLDADDQSDINDFSKFPEILFKHNNINYYGNRHIVYNSIKFLKEIIDVADFSEEIILTCDVPMYIINLYIQSSYTNIFNMHRIKSCDIINFLKFIDQYPSMVLSIDHLESEIIKYFDKNKIEYDDYMINLCLKYQFKILYLDMHNKMLKK